MITQGPPSRDPALDGTLAGVFTLILEKFLQGVDDCLPAVVVSYDRPSKTATVRPIIAMVSTAGQIIQRAPVAEVPVFQMGGGGWFINFDLVPGDLGWIKANDRDMSRFLQSLEETTPNTSRKHSFSDALFFPDQLKGYTLADEDEGGIVVQNLAGTMKVSLTTTRAKVLHPTLIKLDAPNVTCSGILTAAEVAAGVPGAYVRLTTLQVTGVQSGTDTSGPPVATP